MAAELLIDEDAETDIQRIYGYYEDKRQGLGEAFLRELDQAFHDIRVRPRSFPISLGQYRRALTRKFPYAIYFDHDEGENRVVVFVVIHTARGPNALQERLP